MNKLILASASPRRNELLALLNIPFEVRPSSVDEGALSLSGPPARRTMDAALAKASDVSRRSGSAWVLAADTVVCVDERILGKPRDAGEARFMLSLLSGREHLVITGFCLVRGDPGTPALFRTPDPALSSTTDSSLTPTLKPTLSPALSRASAPALSPTTDSSLTPVLSLTPKLPPALTPALSDGALITYVAYERTKVWMAPLSQERISAYIDSGEPMDKAGAYGIQGLGGAFIPRIEGCFFNVMGLPLYRVARLLEQAGVGLDSPFWKEGSAND